MTPACTTSSAPPSENVQAGVIESVGFDEALRLVGERMSVAQGDTLEIGVRGFPPARYECAEALLDGTVFWKPAAVRLAA